MPRSSLSSPFCPSHNSAKEHGCRIDFRLKSCQRRREAAICYKRRLTLRWFWDDVFRANVAYGSIAAGALAPGQKRSPLWRSRRCDPSTSGRYGRSFRSKAAFATSPCSIWRSTANSVAVMSWPIGSRMSPQADSRPIARRSDGINWATRQI
jgi:hypothetical protein